MKFLIALFLWFGLGVVPMAMAQTIDVGELAVLVDTEGSETIDTVSAAGAHSRFTRHSGHFSSGYTRSAHWLRFTVKTPMPGEWWLEVQPPFLDDLRLYEPGDTGYIEHRTGDQWPFSTREVDYRGFVFKFTQADTASRTFYLRLQTTSTSLAILKLWQPQQFQAAKQTEYGVLGVFYGFLLLVLMLNLSLWIGLRESLYGWFSLCVVANMIVFFGSNGLVAQYLLPESPRLADQWVGLGLFFAFSASAPFYRRMLRLEPSEALYFNLYRIQLFLPLLLMVPLVMGYYPEAARILVIYAVLTAVLMLFRAFHMWRQGQHESPYLLLAICVTLFTGLSSWLLLMGVIPGLISLFYLRQVSLLIIILAMQYALAIRLRVIHRNQQQAHERFKRAQMEAILERARHAEQGRFIAMLSHELKTPLAVIDSAAQALERMDHSRHPETTRRHARIRRSVGRIDRLVEQFLNKDRLESGGLHLKCQPVDLSEMLHQVIQASDDEPGRRLQLHAPDPLPLLADAALLQVVVANLTDNALKYAPLGTQIMVSARSSPQRGEKGVAITIADEGPGVPPELHAHLFEPYTRGDNAAHVAGAGLGLYLVRRIVELHGGRIELRPPPGGAVFHLWLPTERGALS